MAVYIVFVKNGFVFVTRMFEDGYISDIFLTKYDMSKRKIYKSVDLFMRFHVYQSCNLSTENVDINKTIIKISIIHFHDCPGLIKIRLTKTRPKKQNWTSI